MSRWEVCESKFTVVQDGGWSKKRIIAYQARQVDPAGTMSVIAEERWEVDSGPNRAEMTLVARLGRDGWEPMPISIGTSHEVTWYFKRQLPDDAP